MLLKQAWFWEEKKALAYAREIAARLGCIAEGTRGVWQRLNPHDPRIGVRVLPFPKRGGFAVFDGI